MHHFLRRSLNEDADKERRLGRGCLSLCDCNVQNAQPHGHLPSSFSMTNCDGTPAAGFRRHSLDHVDDPTATICTYVRWTVILTLEDRDLRMSAHLYLESNEALVCEVDPNWPPHSRSPEDTASCNRCSRTAELRRL